MWFYNAAALNTWLNVLALTEGLWTSIKYACGGLAQPKCFFSSFFHSFYVFLKPERFWLCSEWNINIILTEYYTKYCHIIKRKNEKCETT